MVAIIRDNGRGSEIVGSDVTVFDVMDGLRYRLYPSVIGQLFDLSEDDVDAAIHYIDVNRRELDIAYESIRAARSCDFPILENKLESIREDYRRKWEQGLRTAGHGFPEWADFDKPFIFDRGRGPEIIGSRITVYDIMDYLNPAWPAPAIAWWLRLTVPQVEAAIAYIASHREEVQRNYQIILDRCARGNPPHIQAKLDAIAGSARALRDRLRQEKSLREVSGAGPSGRS